MALVGIIGKKREIQSIKKELANEKVEVIQINKQSIKNIKSVFFEYLVIIEDINLDENEYQYMKNLISKANYLIINADIEIKCLKYINIENPVKIITFGFNAKSTITVSSVNDEKILVCLQRSIKNFKNEIVEEQEKEIKVTENYTRKVHSKLVVFIIKELHNI